MKIGIVGLGIVGTACQAGFESCGYTVKVHDIKLNTQLSDLLDTEIVYLSVPTPSNQDGSCNTSIVENTIAELRALEYAGVIAIKSTVVPGFTQQMIEKYDDRIVFVPEFLKERSAEYDFIFDHKLLLVGTENVNHYYLVTRSHGALPQTSQRVSPGEAELVKYYHNTFNAVRIVFANIFYEISKQLGTDYDKIKTAFLVNNRMPDEYLDVKDELRGYGGACLPKDVLAMQDLCNRLNIPHSLFQNINDENAKFKRTVFEGMRDS
jgi:UDPglucose 6-dehydrogenase